VNASAGGDTLVVNVRGGTRICVPRALDQITPYILLEQDDWFEDEIRFVRRWLQPGMSAVDVGANYGVYTIAAATAVGRTGRVWAFEPTPRCADYLERTIELNGCTQVILRREAVSDRGGTVAFSLTAQPELNAIAAPGAAGQDVVTVQAVTLDEMARIYDWRDVDFVKLDVEGHEIQAIHGAAAFFASNSPLVMLEVKAKSLERIDLAALELLSGMGYELYRLLPGPLLLTPFDTAEPVDDFQLNLFACKPERARRLAADGLLDDGISTEVSQAGAGPWMQYVSAAPYARELAARWPSKARSFSGADDKAFYEGIAAFARSREITQSAAQRCLLLNHASDCIEQAVLSTDRLGRLISYARIAWELGRRSTAVDALLLASQRLDAGSAEALAEPFLAPGPRYDAIVCPLNAAAWLHCAVIEQFEDFRCYSSVFMGDQSSAKILEPIIALPFSSPEVERRSQLVRIKGGRQAAPEPSPRLCMRSEENLNPEFWCGMQHSLSSA
jgi:FkbM family methyltransferase